MSINKPLFNADGEDIYLNPYDVSLEPDKRKFKLFLVILGICSLFLFIGGLIIFGKTLIEYRMEQNNKENEISGITTPEWIEIVHYRKTEQASIHYGYDEDKS